jgi:hypothetical protein
MTLSIPEIIPNLQQSTTFKNSLQVGFHREVVRDASQPDGDFEQVVRTLKGKNKGNEGENSNVEK